MSLSSDLRGAILASGNTLGRRKLVKFNGHDIEIKQPSIGQMLAMEQDADKFGFVEILIEHAYVPGTNEKVFEPINREELMSLPFTVDCRKVVAVLEELVNLSVNDAVKN